MTTPITPPKATGPERASLGERLMDAKDALAIAYHGLLATRLDERIGDAHQDLARAAHDELFYDGLRSASEAIVKLDYDGLDHFPAPSSRSLRNRGALGRQVESHRRMSEPGSLGTGTAVAPPYKWPEFPDEPSGIVVEDLSLPTDPTTGEPVRPRTPKQERHDQGVARRIDNIRRARKTNVRNAKAYGASGQVSERATRHEQVRREKEIKARYKRGEITSHERLEMLRMVRGHYSPVETVDPATGLRTISHGESFAVRHHPRGVHHQEHRSHKASYGTNIGPIKLYRGAFDIARSGKKEAQELREEATERLPKLTKRRKTRYAKKASAYARRLDYETRDRDPSNPADW